MKARPSYPRRVGQDGKAEGVGVLRAASSTASVLLCDFHLFALCDCDTVADCGGERVDGSVRTLVEEYSKERLQEQSDYFEREGPINRRFLDERCELDG